MSHPLVIPLFLAVAGAVGVLIKWEYKRFRRRQPYASKAFNRQMEELRQTEPGRAYTPPPQRTRRAFEPEGGRR